MEIDHIDPNSRLHETSVLLVHDNEQDVMVELEHLSDGWKLCGEKVEVRLPSMKEMRCGGQRSNRFDLDGIHPSALLILLSVLTTK